MKRRRVDAEPGSGPPGRRFAARGDASKVVLLLHVRAGNLVACDEAVVVPVETLENPLVAELLARQLAVVVAVERVEPVSPVGGPVPGAARRGELLAGERAVVVGVEPCEGLVVAAPFVARDE